MLFTYATARSLVSASAVAKGLSTQISVIAYNGAFIFHPATGEILSSEGFGREEREKAVRIMKEQKPCLLVYSFVDGIEKVSWVRSRENEGIRRYLSLRKGDRRLNPLPDEEKLFEGDIFYFTCIGEKQELIPVYEIFSGDERYTCTFQQELYRPEYWELKKAATGVIGSNDGDGVAKWLKEHYQSAGSRQEKREVHR